jgi:hypothetical protein
MLNYNHLPVNNQIKIYRVDHLINMGNYKGEYVCDAKLMDKSICPEVEMLMKTKLRNSHKTKC